MQTAALTTKPPKNAPAAPPPESVVPPAAPQPLFADGDDEPATIAAAPVIAALETPPPAPAYVPPPRPPEPVAAPVRIAAPKMNILDTTAITTVRTHEMIVNGQTVKVDFPPRAAVPLPPAVAVKFLAHEAFKLCDEDGNIMPWSAVPKQPHQLEAGERFRLDPDQTVARYDELQNKAIKIRALQLPGGERYADSTDREAMIAFIISETEALRRKNIGREGGTAGPDGLEEFTPPPEDERTFFGDEF